MCDLTKMVPSTAGGMQIPMQIPEGAQTSVMTGGAMPGAGIIEATTPMKQVPTKLGTFLKYAIPLVQGGLKGLSSRRPTYSAGFMTGVGQGYEGSSQYFDQQRREQDTLQGEERDRALRHIQLQQQLARDRALQDYRDERLDQFDRRLGQQETKPNRATSRNVRDVGGTPFLLDEESGTATPFRLPSQVVPNPTPPNLIGPVVPRKESFTIPGAPLMAPEKKEKDSMDEELSPSEAERFGVPFGTKKRDVVGKTTAKTSRKQDGVPSQVRNAQMDEAAQYALEQEGGDVTKALARINNSPLDENTKVLLRQRVRRLAKSGITNAPLYQEN